MIEVLPDSVGPSSTLRVPRSSVSETSRMVGMPSTDRVTFSSVTVMFALPLPARDAPDGTWLAVIQSSRAAISPADSRNPSFDRRQTISSALRAHSFAIRYLTSLSVKVAPNDWPRSASDFALPSSLVARVP